MRPFYWLTLVLLMFLASELEAQARPANSPAPNAASWRARPLPRELAWAPAPMFRVGSPDSTRHRPFYLPRPGEHAAYWAGFGAGLALSPLLWCAGPGCGTVGKASTSLGLAVVGAVSGLLLSRTF